MTRKSLVSFSHDMEPLHLQPALVLLFAGVVELLHDNSCSFSLLFSFRHFKQFFFPMGNRKPPSLCPYKPPQFLVFRTMSFPFIRSVGYRLRPTTFGTWEERPKTRNSMPLWRSLLQWLVRLYMALWMASPHSPVKWTGYRLYSALMLLSRYFEILITIPHNRPSYSDTVHHKPQKHAYFRWRSPNPQSRFVKKRWLKGLERWARKWTLCIRETPLFSRSLATYFCLDFRQKSKHSWMFEQDLQLILT